MFKLDSYPFKLGSCECLTVLPSNFRVKESYQKSGSPNLIAPVFIQSGAPFKQQLSLLTDREKTWKSAFARQNAHDYLVRTYTYASFRRALL